MQARLGYDRRAPGLGQVEPLRRDRLQPRQELEAEQPAEGERHLALPVAVHVLALDLHLGVVAQHALDHGGDLGRRAAPQPRVDAHRAALDVPVDHDAAPAVAGVPLGHQVLVEGAEVLAVRRAGGRALAPDAGGDARPASR